MYASAYTVSPPNVFVDKNALFGSSLLVYSHCKVIFLLPLYFILFLYVIAVKMDYIKLKLFS